MGNCKKSVFIPNKNLMSDYYGMLFAPYYNIKGVSIWPPEYEVQLDVKAHNKLEEDPITIWTIRWMERGGTV